MQELEGPTYLAFYLCLFIPSPLKPNSFKSSVPEEWSAAMFIAIVFLNHTYLSEHMIK